MGLVALLCGCGASYSTRPWMAVHGDSLAAGSRDGLAKIYNLAPDMDGERWFNIVARELEPAFRVENTGVGGSGMAANIQRMRGARATASVTIFYDRVNDDETVEAYLRHLETVVLQARHGRVLIVPQVPMALRADSPATLAKMEAINTQVRARWPNSTFSAAETAAFHRDLNPVATRYDGLHRNAKGQAIEARHIGPWITAHWLSPA